MLSGGTAPVWNASGSVRDFTVLSTYELSELLLLTGVDGNLVLDLGCGTGQLSRDFFHRGFEVIGVDNSAPAIAIARGASRYVEYVVADIERPANLRMADGRRFSLVVCKFVYAFVRRRRALQRWVRKHMTRQGVFLIVTQTTSQVDADKRHVAIDLDSVVSDLALEFETVVVHDRGNYVAIVCRARAV